MHNESKYNYQENKKAYNFVLIALTLNTMVIISLLKAIPLNYIIGAVIIFNIIYTLLGFLLAIRVKIYNVHWAKIAIVFGFIQFFRVIILPLEGFFGLALILKLLLIISGVLMITASIVTLNRAKIKAGKTMDIESN
ncbi:hypothetical protein QBE53_15505 [Vallitaleaceae bacterium 9-2]